MRIDERVARCLTHLRGPEFEPLLGYLEAKRLQALENMALTTDEKLIFRLQGEVGALGELISNVKGAEALIAKLKKNS
jgi:hypothetical protein